MKKPREPSEVTAILRKLRGIRKRTGVAQEMGISYSMLSKIEGGFRTPGEDLKKRIAEYYGVSEDDIFFTEK